MATATVLRTAAVVAAPVEAVRSACGDAGEVLLAGKRYPVLAEAVGTGAGTLLTCSVSWCRFGAVLDPLLWRRKVLRELATATDRIRARATR